MGDTYERASHEVMIDALAAPSLRAQLAAKDAEIAELSRRIEILFDATSALQFAEMRKHAATKSERDEARECVKRLQNSSQAVLDRWHSPMWQWHNQGPTAELMNDLRDALAATPEHLR